MKADKLKGLFINCVEAEDSIFESGRMVFNCLEVSEAFTLDYVELDRDSATVSANYDFYFFNYHLVTMSWLDTASIRGLLPGTKITMVLEVAPNDPFVYCPPNHFDAYCVLDPTLKIDAQNVFSFPRPLESPGDAFEYRPKDVPLIGSFGFATTGKGFERVVDAANREFDKAVVRINIPFGAYNDEGGEFARHLAKTCKERAKVGIEVIVTHDFMSKPELINWCRQNTLNCFFYDRNMPGLAATTDQAIASGRPLLISKNSAFRHIQSYIKPFPYQSLREAIANTEMNVKQMQIAWSPSKFRERFEQVLESLEIERSLSASSESIRLKTTKAKQNSYVQTLKEKVRLRTRSRLLSDTFRNTRVGRMITGSKTSYSQFGEDTIISDLLNDLGFNTMSYLDIGANNPKYISNTFLFYERGFGGVLVEPNAYLCKKLAAIRPRDKVLNFGIGIDPAVTEADFYLYDDEADGLSTFSFEEAKHWEEVGMGGKKYRVKEVIKMPLVNVNDVISGYFTEFPDLISIDVEGWDLEILNTFDFTRYSPVVFCVETLAYNGDGSTYKNENVSHFFETKGYFPYRETYANTIFVNKNLYGFSEYQKAEEVKNTKSFSKKDKMIIRPPF